MAHRPGIGATVASAAFFSFLLISSMTILDGSSQRAGLAMTADAESSVYTDGQMAAADAALGALEKIQLQASSSSIQCSSANATLDAIVAESLSSATYGPAEAQATPSLVLGSAGPDNLTAASPFDGGTIGDLSVEVIIVAHGANETAGVAYSRTESHLLHLGVRWGALRSICLQSISRATSELEASKAGNCTTAFVDEELTGLTTEFKARAEAYGLGFRFGVSVLSVNTCLVGLSAWVSEPGAAGPLGAFPLSMSQQATAVQS